MVNGGGLWGSLSEIISQGRELGRYRLISRGASVDVSSCDASQFLVPCPHVFKSAAFRCVAIRRIAVPRPSAPHRDGNPRDFKLRRSPRFRPGRDATVALAGRIAKVSHVGSCELCQLGKDARSSLLKREEMSLA